MNIVSFVYCEDTVDQNGKTVIINPMQMFTPVGIPSNYSFVISFGIFDYEKDRENSINIIFKSPEGKKLVESKIDVPMLPDEARNATLPIGLQFNLGFRNVVLERPGEYTTIIEINGKELGIYPINVVHGN